MRTVRILTTAAELLSRVDARHGKSLRDLVALKPAAHYGAGLLTDRDRLAALRTAGSLVGEARERTT